jgi:hypothetical protein
MDPLIVTAALDPVAARVFDDLRKRHFPADRNVVPAHLTLFHQLPGTHQAAWMADIEAERPAAGPIPFATGALRFLGRGVAIDIACPPLEALRKGLAARWSDVLTPQDRQTFRPHVTIQNKVAAATARALFESLATNFMPVRGAVIGLDLWWYRGGPWEHAGATRWSGARGDDRSTQSATD